MKLFVKILLPLVLIAAIGVGSVWYFTEYDPAFTHGVLLSCARYFEKHGNHAIATWFYDKAYVQGDNNEDTALELASYYRSVGNFTKVEETLSRAIRDGGGTKVYVALCRAFVEQDKLLDALQLLSNIEDPAIRAEIEKQRPDAPKPGLPAGDYSEYISLDFHAGKNKIYVTDKDFPSVNADLYTEPITLPSGETRLFAIAVGENGLISPMTELVYTVVGIIEPVTFADSSMEEAIRDLAGIPAGKTVYTNDLWDIQSFTIPEDAWDYSDLRHLPFLVNLTVSASKSSLAPISYLTELRSLSIQSSELDADTITAITSLKSLTKLTLRGCGITSLSGFEKLTELTFLDLGQNVVRNLTPLSSLTKLTELYLDNNAVVDLSALRPLTSLTVLDVYFNSISDISPLSKLTKLRKLNLSTNLLTDISTVSKLSNLEELDLSHNRLVNVKPIASCKKLTELNIANNSVKDILSFSALVKLEVFNFDNNQVVDLPTWPKTCALVTISGSYNKLFSIKQLAGLQNLNSVFADHNPKVSNVNPLANCPNLVVLSIFGTAAKDVGDLINSGVIVYADLN